MRAARALALALAVVALAPAAWAAEPRPEAFGWSAPLALEGREAVYAAELPLAVYAGTLRRDLGDLRVFNGAGEAVPHALTAVAPPDAQARPLVELPIFPLWTAADAEVGALAVRIEQGKGGTIVGVQGADKSPRRPRLAGYLLDASAVAEPLQALHVAWETPAGGFAGRVRVEASDDLARWAGVVADAPLVDLRHAGQTLAQRRIALGRAKARYLRISWAASQQTPQFTRVSAELEPARPALPRAWHSAAGVALERPGEYLFDLGGHAPFDRLRLELPDANVVVPVEFLVRSTPEAPWRRVAAATVYRLVQRGETYASADTEIAPTRERHWLVRADVRGGGFGAGAPRLTAGFVPQRLLFVARGEGPFTLAFGAAGVAGAALAPSALVPGADNEVALKAAHATIGTARERAQAQAAWYALAPGTWKRIALWAILVAGVAVLGWMAWRLGRRMEPRDRA